MTAKEKPDELETCPYCGVPLTSRYAMRQHLTLRVCQGGSDAQKIWREERPAPSASRAEGDSK